MVKTLVLIFVLLLAGTLSYSGGRGLRNLISPGNGEAQVVQRGDSTGVGAPESVVREIERAILAEDAKEVAQHFDKQVFLSLQSNEGSYYSSNQAQYVLQNFFTTHRIISFKFTSFNVTDGSSYATGGGKIRMKGNRNTVQVYVSLTKTGDRWMVSQFNVY